MLLQIVITMFVLVVGTEVYLSYKNKNLSAVSFIFWMSIWVGILIVVWYARFTVYLAEFLHIERGIDSVVYLSIVILFYLVFRLLIKLEHTERLLEKAVREVALLRESLSSTKK